MWWPSSGDSLVLLMMLLLTWPVFMLWTMLWPEWVHWYRPHYTALCTRFGGDLTFENYLHQKYFCKTIRNASFSRHLKCKLWRICSIYFWNKTWFYLVRKMRFLLFCFRSMIKHENYFRSALRKVSSKYTVQWRGYLILLFYLILLNLIQFCKSQF